MAMKFSITIEDHNTEFDDWISWKWEVNNGQGLSCSGYTMTLRKAHKQAKKAMKKIEGVAKWSWPT